MSANKKRNNNVPTQVSQGYYNAPPGPIYQEMAPPPPPYQNFQAPGPRFNPNTHRRAPLVPPAMTNQPIAKRTRLTNIECQDIISNLPDEILCHILSFLETKASAATSILSRRWRFMWTHVMSIDISSRTDRIGSDVFPDMVNKVFLKNTARTMNTFHLSAFNCCTQTQFETWIFEVVARNVRSIDLYVNSMLPHCLFSAKTLVECTLCICTYLCDGPAISLPNLKKLHLELVHFESNDFLAELISGCLALEELIIESTQIGSLSSISLPTLKRFSLNKSIDGGSMVKLNTPALQYLFLHEYLPNRISAQNLSSLVEAEFRLRYSFRQDCVPYQRSVIELVESVSTVKCLKLDCLMEMKLPIPAFTSPTAKFSNLIKLDFEADWRLLTRLLESADRLEVLIIRTLDNSRSCWRDPEKVPECLLSCLKTVTILNSEDVDMPETGILMVRYILRNAKFLKMMKIQFLSGYICRPDERLDISLFPRGSDACEVFIFDHSDLDFEFYL